MDNRWQGIGHMNQTTPTFSYPSVPKMSLEAAMCNLAELHEWVGRENQRIELTARTGPSCVIISKSELDALEQALEILSETGNVQAMRKDLAKLAALTNPA